MARKRKRKTGKQENRKTGKQENRKTGKQENLFCHRRRGDNGKGGLK
jgi:hypothetical protein